ncbi:MAG: hypothetical protein AAGJ87_15890, partial [Pseudomonadota bacterium]
MAEHEIPSWSAIETRSGFEGMARFAQDALIPALSTIAVEETNKDGAPKGLHAPIGVAFTCFGVFFFGLEVLLPSSRMFDVLRFVFFPFLFFAFIGAALYMMRDRILDLLTRGQERFITRSTVLRLVAEKLDLEYTPAPGGAPPALRAFAQWKHAPQRVREIADLIDDHGGLDAPVEIARRSGLLSTDIVFLGGANAKRNVAKDRVENRQLEDGFSGSRAGRAFSAFEWVENDSDSPSVYHLMVVVAAPMRLNGVTQLRTRDAIWPDKQGAT